MNFAYKSNEYNVNLLCYNCQYVALKQDGMYFVLCPKKGNKIEGGVLSRVCILGYFWPKQGQGFKSLAAHLYPNIAQVPALPLGLSIQYVRDD